MSFTPGFDPTTVGMYAEPDDPNALLAQSEGGYVEPDVETDQDAIAQQVFDALAQRAPGWQAHDGNLDTWLIEAWAEVGSEIRQLAASVPASIFMTYGQNVLGIDPYIATAATGSAVFTTVDNQGYTLDTGTQFALARSGNDLIAYATQQEADIPAGSTTATVPFTAVETGAAGNGLSGAGQLLDPVTWITTIAVATPTANGADEETAEDYLDRISLLFQMVALRPVLPQDFAILALQVPGVGRAIAMNLYDPGTNTWTNARTVTLMLTDPNGQPCTTAVKQAVHDSIEALREVNWVINIIDPIYTPINVAFDVVAFAGQDAPTVQAACIAGLTAYLQPNNYRLGEGSPAIEGGEVIYPPTTGSQPRHQAIHLNDLVALLDRCLGVDWVVSVKIQNTAADFVLPDPYSLPTPGTITGTVEGGMS